MSAPDENNKVLVRASGGNFLFIPLEYVQDIGFN
jgi:sporulation protein YlmC with PRC-barrel domain